MIYRLTILILAMMLALLALLVIADPIDAAESPTKAECTADSELDCGPGRWLWVGKWDGLLRCESRPTRGTPHLGVTAGQRAEEVRVDQTGTSGERSGFQFMRSTWNRIAVARNRPGLIGDDPYRKTLAQQLRQATWLRRNVGLSQWACGRFYGTGDGWIYLTGLHHETRHPEKCRLNLIRRHHIGRKIARSVCDA